MEKDLIRLSEQGLNAVLHTFSERDQRYNLDTIGEIVDLSHDLNFNVYMNPWGLGNTFGGEALSNFVTNHPEARQVSSSRTPLPAACLNHPSYRKFLENWIEDAISTGADVLFWDEPHWLTPSWRNSRNTEEGWTCTCDYCRTGFKQMFGSAMPETLTRDIRMFRQRSIVSLIDQLTSVSAKLDVENAACFVPGEGTEHGFSDWTGLGTLEHVDTIAVTPFWSFHDHEPESFVKKWSETIMEIGKNFNWKTQVWIQGFLLDGNPSTLRKHRMAIQTALDCGPDSLFIWGWDGCRVMSSIACENPMEVWNTFIEEIRNYTK